MEKLNLGYDMPVVVIRDVAALQRAYNELLTAQMEQITLAPLPIIKPFCFYMEYRAGLQIVKWSNLA